MNLPSDPNPGTHRLPRVGLVGVTGWGASHLKSIQMLVDGGLAEWGAVTIVNPQEAEEAVSRFRESRVPIYSDFNDMLAQEAGRLDWVSIPTGHGWHFSMARDCLLHNLHVYVEKPLATTLQDVRELRRLEKERGLRIAVGFQHVFQGIFRQVKDEILNGEIGDLVAMRCLAMWPRSVSYYQRNSWAGKLHDGRHWILDSPLGNALSHSINLMLFLAGEQMDTSALPISVSAELYRAKSIENYDTVWTQARTAKGANLQATLTHSSLARFDPEIVLIGTRGKMILRPQGDQVIIKEKEVRVLRGCPEEVGIPIALHHANQYFAGLSAPVCNSAMAEATSMWINAAQECGPPTKIPQEQIVSLNNSGEIFECVLDLEYWSHRTHYEGKSFHALGLPWANSPKLVYLNGYGGYSASM